MLMDMKIADWSSIEPEGWGQSTGVVLDKIGGKGIHNHWTPRHGPCTLQILYNWLLNFIWSYQYSNIMDEKIKHRVVK